MKIRFDFSLNAETPGHARGRVRGQVEGPAGLLDGAEHVLDVGIDRDVGEGELAVADLALGDVLSVSSIEDQMIAIHFHSIAHAQDAVFGIHAEAVFDLDPLGGHLLVVTLLLALVVRLVAVVVELVERAAVGAGEVAVELHAHLVAVDRCLAVHVALAVDLDDAVAVGAGVSAVGADPDHGLVIHLHGGLDACDARVDDLVVLTVHAVWQAVDLLAVEEGEGQEGDFLGLAPVAGVVGAGVVVAAAAPQGHGEDQGGRDAIHCVPRGGYGVSATAWPAQLAVQLGRCFRFMRQAHSSNLFIEWHR